MISINLLDMMTLFSNFGDSKQMVQVQQSEG